MQIRDESMPKEEDRCESRATSNFGIDPDEFLSEQSKMFQLFLMKKFQAEPVKVFSLTEAIKDYNRM